MSPAEGKRARGDEEEAKTGAGEYPDVMAPRPMSSAYLPGLTRSVYERDHAVITQESRVWCGLPGWTPGKHSGAYLTSPQMPGAVFSMLLVRVQPGCTPAPPLPGVERFMFLIQGEVSGSYQYQTPGGSARAVDFKLRPGKEEYAFFPAGTDHAFEAAGSGGEEAVILLFEQVYRPHPRGDGMGKKPEVVVGNVDAQATLDPGAPEVFGLRKLLPLSEEYDFNIHIMDFQPGQYLHCNEMHYNQHGMLVLEGQGIYRLRDDKWYHVRAGDAIYMAPYVPQWYAALEPGRTRYILYKDTYRDPLQSGSAGIVHHSAP